MYMHPKSGKPVFGQKQLNSGIDTETVYFFFGYALSTITKSVAAGLLGFVDI